VRLGVARFAVAGGSGQHHLRLLSRTVSAAEANRSFSRLLREVRETGAKAVITAHGRPVAMLVPAKAYAAARTQARAALRQRLAAQPATEAGRWSRDELYAR